MSYFKIDAAENKTFNLEYSGLEDTSFIVKLKNKAGDLIELLANKIGPYTGSKSVALAGNTDYQLNIEAEGKWTIDME